MVIGLEDTGAELEFEILHKTEKAYRLRDNLGNEFWLPKSVFGSDGILTEFGEQLYEQARGL